MIFDINLASIYYSKIIEENTLLKKINLRTVEVLPGIKGHEALCFFHDMEDYKVPNYCFHSSAMGVGCSTNKQVAIYKSISEALERWAFLVLEAKGIIHSTNGLAAFPGLTGLQAKSNSLTEAFERWCICLFNLGQLPLTPEDHSPNIDTYSYRHRKTGRHFVISHHQVSDIHVYGFGAGLSLKLALESALKELMRNKRTFTELNIPNSSTSLQERRLIYFSQNDGFLNFQEMLSTCLETRNNPHELKVLEQKRIKGPWNQFTQVYFSKVEMPLDLHSTNENFFYF